MILKTRRIQRDQLEVERWLESSLVMKKPKRRLGGFPALHATAAASNGRQSFDAIWWVDTGQWRGRTTAGMAPASSGRETQRKRKREIGGEEREKKMKMTEHVAWTVQFFKNYNLVILHKIFAN
ncbi:hypothetical protein PanWU01x14_160790 [Parasponia andersonii]|uniref:Uncharacterized protein n=1 Tax=Parasponia andersonii TaxID=3476 RepID=A0A2P5CE46_PARAD|nr:hypothetical protein PanWU01x14_160790 [Parasponia andersonii]